MHQVELLLLQDGGQLHQVGVKRADGEGVRAVLLPSRPNAQSAVRRGAHAHPAAAAAAVPPAEDTFRSMMFPQPSL